MTPAAGIPTPPTRARPRVLAGVTLVIVVGAALAAVLTTRAHHTPHHRRATLTGAATVQRRNLVTSENETGTISYAGSSTVTDRLAGTLTWVPSVGHVVDPGQPLFDVDAFPVILMSGTTPAYRPLEPSDTPGPDIAQLNADLVHLGFNPDGIAAGDEWQPATTAGVVAFQQANHEPQTGRLNLGAIVFLHGPQRISSLQGAATSVDDHAPSAPVAEFAGDDLSNAANAATGAAATQTTTTATTVTAPAPPARPATRRAAAVSHLAAQVRQLQDENRRLAHEAAHARASLSAADSGPATGGDEAVMATTSTTLVVTVDVPAGQQSLTRVGARVPVTMPSGATVRGHVVSIGTSGGNSKIPVTIHLDRRENGRDLDQASVGVTFVERTARHVLSVPVTALLAQPGGHFAVQEATAPFHLLGVDLGRFATGYVQVTGTGLHAGLKITNAQG